MSNTVIVLFPPADLQRDAWFASSKPKLIEAYRDARYWVAARFESDKSGKDAAEDAFDMSNNPSRQYERDEIYCKNIIGTGLRSISVGDMVKIGDEVFLCQSFGWEKIN